MNAIVEAKLKDYLVVYLKYKVQQVGAILTQIDALASMAGFDVDDSFAVAGLGAGPEARVASGIVSRALGHGGGETSEFEIRTEIDAWLRKFPAVMRGV